MTFHQCRELIEQLAENSTLASNTTIDKVIQTCTRGNVAAEAAGNIFNTAAGEVFPNLLTGILIALGLTLALILIAGVYIYTSLAWYTIAKKLKYKRPWIAWIPIVNWAMILQLGGFHWALIFLLLIPLFGWIAIFILLIIARWFIYEKRKFPGWFSLALIIPKAGSVLHLIAIGFVAWGRK